MTKPARVTATPEAGFTRFQVRDGMRLIACSVADEALEAVAGLESPATVVARRKSFDRFRTLIDAAAKLKLGECATGFGGPLVLSSGDLRRVPATSGMPSYGRAR